MKRDEKTYIIVAVTCFAFLGVGLANMDVQPTKRVSVPVKVQNTKTIYKTRKVIVHDPPTQPSGYIPRDKCYTIAEGSKFKDLIFRWGWPANDDATDSYAGFLHYPLAEDHDKYCVVMFDRGEVQQVSIDLQ